MSADKNQIDISAFLIGKYIYLRPPNIEKDVLNGKWFSWFNNKQVTKHLAQGVFPNTIDKQIDFVESLKKDSSKAVLCIINKADDNHIGVISFSGIDFLNRKAGIAIVMGVKKYPPAAPLEAMALMTEYGFDRLNLNKIDASQSEDIWSWVNILKLIGYKIEGYIESLAIRDGRVQDGVHTGITAERFYRLRKERNGNICTDDILNLLHQRSKKNVIEKIKFFLENVYNEQ